MVGWYNRSLKQKAGEESILLGLTSGSPVYCGVAVLPIENAEENLDVSNGPTFFSSQFGYGLEPVREDPVTGYALDQKYHARLNFSTSFKDRPSCAGRLQVRNCTLNPAVLQQRIILENKTILLDLAFDYTSDVVIRADIPAVEHPSRFRGPDGTTSTHGGMIAWLNKRFSSYVNTTMDVIAGLEVYTGSDSGIAFMEYMTSAGGMGGDNARCDITWRDPTPDVMAAARELAFRVAVQAADPKNATNMQPLIDGKRQSNVLVYKSDFRFIGLALTVTLLGLICVAPTLSGWWKLGRHVSLSPLEIAKAFNGVKLEEVDSNADIKKLLKEVGSTPIRYGAVSSGNRLMMENPHNVMDLTRRDRDE